MFGHRKIAGAAAVKSIPSGHFGFACLAKSGAKYGPRRTPSNLGYYVGIDRTNNAMHNVSVWESVGDANQMATFAPMLALAAEFTAIGVRFERPILNCNTLWRLDE